MAELNAKASPAIVFVQTRGLWNRMSENKIFTVVFFFQFRDRIKQVKILESVILISNFDQVQESLTFFFHFSRTIDNLRNLYGNKHL